MNPNDEFDQKTIDKLNMINKVPERNPQNMISGRAAFLDESMKIATNVSPQENRRHKNWKVKQQSQFMVRRKERVPMITTFASIMIAVGLLLGGGGITVAAAQSSLPDDALYEVKLVSENALMDLTTNPESKLDLALDLVDRRVNEMQELVLSGEIPSTETQIRYREQVERALVIALDLPQDQKVQAFEKIQLRLNTQEELILRIQNNGSPDTMAALSQIRSMIQERVQILEHDLRNMEQVQEQQPLQEQTDQPGQQNGSPSSQTTNSAPGTGAGNLWTTGTPIPGSSYGPGESNNPWTIGTPTPGSGYGPGDGTCENSTCVPPQGDGGGNGNNGQGGNTQPSSTPKNGSGNGHGQH